MARPNCKLVSRHSYDPSKYPYRVSPKSDTVPDQNYTVKELATKYQRHNYPPAIVHDDMIYDEEVYDTDARNYQDDEQYENENFEARDLVEIDRAREQLREVKKAQKRIRMERNFRGPRKANQTSNSSSRDVEKPSSSRHDDKPGEE